MKIWIVSDLHCDASQWSPAAVPDHNVLVVAGDVSNSPDGAIIELYRIAQFTHAPIVFVPGNHDVFGARLDDAFDGLVTGAVHVLRPGAPVIIGGTRFVGATLWTDWQLGDKEFAAQSWAARHMPEYSHVVRRDGELIWPIYVYKMHEFHRSSIERDLVMPHAGPTVVVTHHAPSIRSIHPGDRTDVSAAAYASDLEDLMLRHRPALWVHGHIHHASDYMVGATRVVCNPRGYQSADWSERTGWDERLVVEV